MHVLCHRVPRTDSYIYSANAFFAQGVEGFVMYFDQKYGYLGVGELPAVGAAVAFVSRTAATDYKKANDTTQ